MEDNERYKIKNFKRFCEKIFEMSCESIQFEKSEAKKYIKMKNVQQIVKQYAETGLIVNENVTNKIVEELQSWILGCHMAKMCAEGKLNCYWDDKDNCMVFSVAEEGENDGKKHDKS